jgi:hypothetical protein
MSFGVEMHKQEHGLIAARKAMAELQRIES